MQGIGKCVKLQEHLLQILKSWYYFADCCEFMKTLNILFINSLIQNSRITKSAILMKLGMFSTSHHQT